MRSGKRRTEPDPLDREFDFRGAVRGKYYKRYMESSNVVVLDPDVHKRFKNSRAVNKALRSLIRADEPRRGPPKRSARARAKAAARR